MFGIYCRLETTAGGVMCSRRALLRAAWRILSEEGKARQKRDARHAFFRSMLEQHDNARRLYDMYTQ